MTRRFGAEAATYLAEPLLAGIHAGDVDRLSVRRAVSPLPWKPSGPTAALLRAFRKEAHVARTAAGADGDAGGVVSIAAGGLSEMIDALVAALPRRIDSPATRPASSDRAQRAGCLRRSTRPANHVGAAPWSCDAGVRDRAARPLTLNPALALCDEIPYASTATSRRSPFRATPWRIR